MKIRTITAVALVGMGAALGAYAAAMGIGPSSIVGETPTTVQVPEGTGDSCGSIFGSSCCLEGGIAEPTEAEPAPPADAPTVVVE